MWVKGLLIFPQADRLQFPHILHVWNWLQRISSLFSTHPSKMEKLLTIFPMSGILANALFLTSIPHMWKIPHFFLTLKFIAKNNLLYFLTFSNVRKGFHHISPAHLQFPHILHVWNWLQRISSHFSTHSSKLENQTKNSSHLGKCGILANALFLTSIPHTSNIPHFFLTLSSHWNFIAAPRPHLQSTSLRGWLRPWSHTNLRKLAMFTKCPRHKDASGECKKRW